MRDGRSAHGVKHIAGCCERLEATLRAVGDPRMRRQDDRERDFLEEFQAASERTEARLPPRALGPPNREEIEVSRNDLPQQRLHAVDTTGLAVGADGEILGLYVPLRGSKRLSESILEHFGQGYGRAPCLT